MVGDPNFSENLIKAISFPIVTLDASGCIVRCNAAFAKLVSRTPERLENVPLGTMLSEKYSRNLHLALEGSGNGHADGTSVSLRFKHQAKEAQLYTAIVSRHNGGDAGATLLFDRIDPQEGDQSSFERNLADTMLSAIPSLVYLRDFRGRLWYCNDAMVDFLGIARDRLLVSDPWVYPTGEDQVAEYKALERRVLDTGQLITIEERLAGSEGNRVLFRTVKRPVVHDGRDDFVLSVSTNIDRIRDEAMERLHMYEARERFFSAMTHELRTPLNAVMGMAEILLKRNPRKDQKKLLQTLNFSSKSLLGLINNILDFSKLEAGKAELETVNFDFRELLENLHLSLRSWAENKGLQLRLDLHEDIPVIARGDSLKISQVLNNLISNAIKFTDTGYVDIEVENAGMHDSDHLVAITVRDTGIGIGEDQQTVIFDPFRQAASGASGRHVGTGLGLSIVKELVEVMQGELELTSSTGVGTTVRVTLPLQEPDDLPVQSVTLPAVGHAKWQIRLHVLYVEDVSTNQVLIEEMLSDWGIEVDMASNGSEALKKIDGCGYDLILMDIQMPGMDGFETAKRIRERTDQYAGEVPIIAMTGSTSSGIRRKILASGMQDVIQKPINIEELRTKIIEYSNIDEDLIPEPEGEEDARDEPWVSFHRTDRLFVNNRLRYQEFLKMAMEELGINKDLLKAAIKEEDLKAFRSVNHRMKNLLITLEMDELIDQLEHIKTRMTKGTSGPRENGALQRSLTARIDRSLDRIGNKLASLKWQ